MQARHKVLMISAEVVPFAKTGGLGDMVGALSRSLAAEGHDVRVVLPRYYFLDPARFRPAAGPIGVPVGGGEEWCAVLRGQLPDSEVPVYLLDHEGLYGRDGVYGSREVPEFDDNLRRFSMLCRGAFQLCRVLDWVPDVMHCHDWPAALAPVYLQTVERQAPFEPTASVLTIHNLGYQGSFPKEDFPETGLDWSLYHGAGFERFDRVNLLQAGIANADLLTTVSPTYAREIQTEAFGHGLDELLRRRASDLYGVLNGIDYGVWNPETDLHLPAPYSADDLSGKAAAKALLQELLHLDADPTVPVVGMVTRLVDQKGIGELCGPTHGSLYSICSDLAVQVVILGSGERWCEAELLRLAERLPNLSVTVDFNESLAHLIEAGSDLFLMPSLYEPCGLNQMYSLRYGTLPIVRRTGGLADTVESYDQATGEGTGFVFSDATPRAIYDTVGWAVWTWYNRPDHFDAMRRRAMSRRFEWAASAHRYAELYQWAIDRRLDRTPRVR